MKGAYVETVIYFFMFITMMLQILFYCVLAERLTEQVYELKKPFKLLFWLSYDLL